MKKVTEKMFQESANFVQSIKSLRTRISPFVLRRTKEDVLDDLPPKIIQDAPCQLTDIQSTILTKALDELYSLNSSINLVSDTTDGNKGMQALENIRYHRTLSNHPKLLLDSINKKPELNNLFKTDSALKKVYKELNNPNAN
jgi:TATA-binding protein-associated factor